MKLLAIIAISSAASAQAFVPISPSGDKALTELSAVSRSRRSVISVASGFLLGTLAGPRPGHSQSTANPFFEDEVNFEPSQQARGDKIDINGAFVIASHGPYANVKHDKFMFKKYQAELTVLPPGRMFDERINQRQST
ncbi:hypothetical protein ACHAWF_011697 [Thalassiosira exigua]